MKTLMLPAFILVLAVGSTALTPLVAPVPCTMSNGQPRPFPCEFQIVAIHLLGKNNEVVGTLKPGSTTVKLPKSKAISNPQNLSGESFIYNASLDFRRINTPSFPPKPIPKGLPGVGFYQISTSAVNFPVSPSELTIIKRLDSSPAVPPPISRPNRVAFTLQLNYTKGAGAALTAPIVQYIQIANPITFTKLPNAISQYRDRAEAFMAFNASVDMSK